MLKLQNQNLHRWLVRAEYKNQSGSESLSLTLQSCSSVSTGEVVQMFSWMMKTLLTFDPPFHVFIFLHLTSWQKNSLGSSCSALVF